MCGPSVEAGGRILSSASPEIKVNICENMDSGRVICMVMLYGNFILYGGANFGNVACFVYGRQCNYTLW
jgi:hypothetical protein